MWIVRGVSLGLFLFVVFAVRLYFHIMAPAASSSLQTGTSLGLIKALSYCRPEFRLVLFALVFAGCGMFRLLEKGQPISPEEAHQQFQP